MPHSPMYTTAGVPDDAQATHRQLFVETEHPVAGTFRTVCSPVSFDGQRPLEVNGAAAAGRTQRGTARVLEAARQTAKETRK